MTDNLGAIFLWVGLLAFIAAGIVALLVYGVQLLTPYNYNRFGIPRRTAVEHLAGVALIAVAVFSLGLVLRVGSAVLS